MQERDGLLKGVVGTLASMRLTLIIFFTLAAVSVIGTLFPYGMAGSEVHHHYPPALAWLIQTFSLHDMYRTNWFRFLLALLCINLIICSVQRLPKTIKLARQRDQEFSSDKVSKFSQNFQMTTAQPMEKVAPSLEKVIGGEFGPLKAIDSSDKYMALAERGRWSSFMVYFIHLSVLVILVGAIIGSLFGFRGIMNIIEGEASKMVMLSRGHERLELPFTVRCDAFSVSFYEMGTPREYRSDLTILKGDEKILQTPIRVNHPLTYGGITFYQSTYGSILTSLKVEIRDTDSEKTWTMDMQMRTPKTIPGTTDQIQVMDYRENIAQLGPIVIMAMLREGEEPTGAYILLNDPDFHGNKISNYHFAIKEAETAWYTGLQVKSDPGVWVVYVGFSALLIGIIMAYYMSHRKMWVVAEPSREFPGRTLVTLGGRTNRNPLAFEEEFRKVCQSVEQQLKAGENKETST